MVFGFLWNLTTKSGTDKPSGMDKPSDDDGSEHIDPTSSPDYSEVDPTEEEDEMSDGEEDDDDFDLDEWEGRAVRHLMWNDSNHLQVLTQLYGSVWPRVLPYCVANTIMTYVVYYMKFVKDIDITVSPSGHKYMAPLMSFLLVTRLKITFDNYMSHAKNLRILNRSCRDMIANVCLLTSNDTSKRAKQWRQDVTYSTLLLLRVTIAVLEFRSSHEDPWLLPEMASENSEEVKKYSFKSDFGSGSGSNNPTNPPNKPNQPVELHSLEPAWSTVEDNDEEEFVNMTLLKQRLAHVADEDRVLLEEASRAVFAMACNARREILKQRDGTWFQSRELVWQHPCNEETRLLDFISQFLKAFSGLYKLITTPIPMPIVQMCKTFLFVWLFTLPLVLSHKRMNHAVDTPVVCMILAFILTFGFMGIEFVSMELTDPFGEDPSDVDALGNAQLAMEDAYIAIYRLDGRNWAKALQRRLKTKKRTSEIPSSPANSPTGAKSH